MKMRAVCPALAGMLGLFCTMSAQGAVESFSHTTPSQTVPLTDSFLLPGFDPSLGTLTGISLQLNTNATAEVDVLDIASVPQPFSNATASIPVTLTGPGPTTVVDPLTAGPVAGVANPGFNPFPGLPSVSSNSTSVLPANFAPYIGVGLIVPVTASSTIGTYGGTDTLGLGNVFFGGSAVAGAVTTVTYTYTVVPEPTSVGLLLIGGGLLGCRRRKA